MSHPHTNSSRSAASPHGRRSGGPAMNLAQACLSRSSTAATGPPGRRRSARMQELPGCARGRARGADHGVDPPENSLAGRFGWAAPAVAWQAGRDGGAPAAEGAHDDDDRHHDDDSRDRGGARAGVHDANRLGDQACQHGREAQTEVSRGEEREHHGGPAGGSASRLISLRPPRKVRPTAAPPMTVPTRNSHRALANSADSSAARQKIHVRKGLWDPT
jgi:hypothetical protein